MVDVLTFEWSAIAVIYLVKEGGIFHGFLLVDLSVLCPNMNSNGGWMCKLLSLSHKFIGFIREPSFR
jgi:hypothetical protein